MELNEIVENIENINEKILNVFEKDECCIFPLLSVSTDGNIIWIEWAGETIWDSDSDPREFIEETQKEEPLDIFLKREMIKVLEKMKSIKL